MTASGESLFLRKIFPGFLLCQLALHEDVGLFYVQNIGRKPMPIIQNHYIHRHKAAVGE
jgi:hypothetical protein